MPVSNGACSLVPLNSKPTILLWHKNADILKRRKVKGQPKRPASPNVVISKAPAIEGVRVLCAIPLRDKPLSRNDRRLYHWATFKPL
jgi:hypothetical protein